MTDAYEVADPTACEVCGSDTCEEHLPPALDRAAEAAESREARRTIDIAVELERLRVRRDARRQLEAEDRGGTTVEILTLRDLLGEPDPPVHWRIADWQPIESRVVLAAPRKAGKTTLVGSLVRSLVDGDLWLGRSAVYPVRGTVAVIDTEMSRAQLRRWLREQDIKNVDRVVIVPLRGQAAALDLLDPARRAEWCKWLSAGGVEYLIIDCLRPVLDALGLDESREAGRWLVALDALLREARIPDALLVHHMGHTGERSRGDSRLRDWPDVEWRLVRQDEDASPRYLAAYGRDVDVPEGQLAFDPATRRLTLNGGSRKQVRATLALAAVVEVLEAAGDPRSGRQLEARLADSDYGRDTIRAALRHGVAQRQLLVDDGPKNANLYRLPSMAPARPVVDRRAAKRAAQRRRRAASERVRGSAR